jgi:hypothetical protein
MIVSIISCDPSRPNSHSVDKRSITLERMSSSLADLIQEVVKRHTVYKYLKNLKKLVRHSVPGFEAQRTEFI